MTAIDPRPRAGTADSPPADPPPISHASPGVTPATEPVLSPLTSRFPKNLARIFTLPNVLTTVYLIVGGLLLMKHGIWRDEAQAFLIARDSRNLVELFQNLRYEGHPPLWHILLFLLTRITVAPEAMQWLHLLMAAGSVYLVARFSPFPIRAKILFAFGYFTLFEYGLIARNYQLFLLLTLAFCAIWQNAVGKGKRPYLWLGILIFLLCMSHVLGVILGAALGAMLLVESAVTRDGWRAIRKNWLQFPLAILLAASGAWLSVKLLQPPPDFNFHGPGWNFTWNPHQAESTLTHLWQAYVPIPDWNNMHFWESNANFLNQGGPSSLLVKSPAHPFPWGAPATRGLLIAFGAVAMMLMALSWRAVLFFLISTGGMLLFSYAKFEGNVRHHGGLFVALIGAFWIAWALQRTQPAQRWRQILRRIPREAFILLLALQVVGGYIACYYAWNYPFSVAREAAAAIRLKLTPDDQLMTWYDPPTASLAAYLPGRQFFMPESSRWGTFTIWRDADSSPGGIPGATALARKTGKPVVLVYGVPLAVQPGVTFLGGFSGGIVQDENYYFYRVMPATGPAGAPGQPAPGPMRRLLQGLIGN